MDLDHRTFYERLIERADLPTTCQLTPYEYTREFQRLTANGDQVVAITLSSRRSGTCRSAAMAADFPGRVFAADSAPLWRGHTDYLPRCAIGAVIGAHVGPGAIGAAFFQKRL